jgi:hypothetical protein
MLAGLFLPVIQAVVVLPEPVKEVHRAYHAQQKYEIFGHDGFPGCMSREYDMSRFYLANLNNGGVMLSMTFKNGKPSPA